MQLVTHLFGLVELVLQRLLVLVQLPDVAHQVLQVRLQPLVLRLYLALLALGITCYIPCSLLCLLDFTDVVLTLTVFPTTVFDSVKNGLNHHPYKCILHAFYISIVYNINN